MAKTDDEKRVETDEMLPPVVELTPEEGRAFFDARVREEMGIGGEEFLRRLDAGEFNEILDDPDYPYLIYLCMISPLARG
jgi:hypothetical protein